MKIRGFEIVNCYISNGITLPERKTSLSAGYDIAASEDVVIMPHQVTIIPTGLKAYMGNDEYLGLHIRSSFAVKNKVTLINSQGIIDADYYNNPENEGHIMIAVYSHSSEDVLVTKGTRVAQGIFCKYLLIDNDNFRLAETRSGGFGSTGEK
ncbi:dUTP diphosphatase [Dendrosporobacter sp. 1207_IL3150]|uniref:dUTP diphosphatase n=1 Tax=Dendrosporobacter sp. 1207_IL3150 TaxID=3084054 RepID=UPI002FDAD00A